MGVTLHGKLLVLAALICAAIAHGSSTPCAVVADPAGDAGPIVASDGTMIPSDQKALDLVGIGAKLASDSVAVSARLVDPNAPTPRGYDSVSWTISWARPEGGRWFAQATRGPHGTDFTVDADERARQDLPTSGIADGMPAFGDIEAGVVTIIVPTEVLGDPGKELRAFAASTWATGPSGAYTLVDSSRVAAYPLQPC